VGRADTVSRLVAMLHGQNRESRDQTLLAVELGGAAATPPTTSRKDTKRPRKQNGLISGHVEVQVT
jgi:hypothetical protein